ncbi:hypothetical protein [Aeromicrobium stalagmiti]|uniref:hypothetical protein n=1 Tax=Aeromicrobium stalagmiti TaxID=2738988 RepID=UPI00156815E1|nr:hypothetical protein [Aeromicrobium stalagmiti]NRQ49232.1 hypothetical protein [Aeromicrobium stalagmiti]
MLKIDLRIAVLLTLLGAVVALTGVAFLMLAQFQTAGVLIALGLAASAVGYRASTT